MSLRCEVLVVGAGIQGIVSACALGEAGYDVVLVEKGEAGGGTTGSSFRLIHGGLRDLQRLDVRRTRLCIREQGWFMSRLGAYVSPVRCWYPLGGGLLRRPAVFGVAAGVYRGLGAHGWAGVCSLEAGCEATGLAWPGWVRGFATWTDWRIGDVGGLLGDLLEEARGHGVRYRPGCEAVWDAAGGVSLREGEGELRRVKARHVVDCRGLYGDGEGWGVYPSLAFNVLMDRRWEGEGVVGVPTGDGDWPTVFVGGLGGLMYAGTGHVGLKGGEVRRRPTSDEVGRFVGVLRGVRPDLGVDGDAVLRVDGGVLPVRRSGTTELVLHPGVVRSRPTGEGGHVWRVITPKLTLARHGARLLLRAMGGKNF